MQLGHWDKFNVVIVLPNCPKLSNGTASKFEQKLLTLADRFSIPVITATTQVPLEVLGSLFFKQLIGEQNFGCALLHSHFWLDVPNNKCGSLANALNYISVRGQGTRDTTYTVCFGVAMKL